MKVAEPLLLWLDFLLFDVLHCLSNLCLRGITSCLLATLLLFMTLNSTPFTPLQTNIRGVTIILQLISNKAQKIRSYG